VLSEIDKGRVTSHAIVETEDKLGLDLVKNEGIIESALLGVRDLPMQ
jgi:hypothetical protein